MTDELLPDPSPELVSRASAGDERAFASLVRPHSQRLFTFLLHETGNVADAEDLMQDVLVRVWDGLPRYDDRGRFEGWLFTIAYRQVASHFRRSRRRDRKHFAANPRPTVSEATPLAELEAGELATVVSTAIAALSAPQRHVLTLRHATDMTFAEIATAMGQPLSTVLSHMRYALQHIERAVNENR